MSFNGNGTFLINSAGQPVVTGTVISSIIFNALTEDVGIGLSTTITKDGQTVTTALIPFAGGITASADSAFTSTGALQLPASTTANRPVGAPGKIRYNTTLNTFEGYSAAAWGSIGGAGGGGATGAGGDTVFQENQLVVTTSYTLSSGKSAMSVGPITINAGAAVTIPSGHRWVVL